MEDEERKQKSESMPKHSATLMLFIVCLFSVSVSNLPFGISWLRFLLLLLPMLLLLAFSSRIFSIWVFFFSLSFAIRSSNKSYYSLLLTPVQCFCWFCFVLYETLVSILFSFFVCHFLGSWRLYRISTL